MRSRQESKEMVYNDIENQVEGRNPVLEALKSERTIEKILVVKGEHGGPIREILKKARERKIVVQEVARSRIEKLSVTKAHQGVIAFVTPYKYVTVDEILMRASRLNENPFVVVLDKITDPHNFGSILRSAECSGVHGVIIPKRRAVGLTPSVIKASAGAVEFIPVAKVNNISSTLDGLKDKGLWVAGADLQGQIYTKADFKGPIALVIGSEGKGLSRLVREKCDFLVSIPMKGKIESLNASVAAGILMYEVMRQREQG